MDIIDSYRRTVKQLVERYASYKSNSDEINHELVMDTERDHYEVLVIGWQKGRRVYHAMMHFDIIDGKVWIQINNTDRDLATELGELGIPKEDIVLGFHPENVHTQDSPYRN